MKHFWLMWFWFFAIVGLMYHTQGQNLPEFLGFTKSGCLIAGSIAEDGRCVCPTFEITSSGKLVWKQVLNTNKVEQICECPIIYKKQRYFIPKLGMCGLSWRSLTNEELNKYPIGRLHSDNLIHPKAHKQYKWRGNVNDARICKLVPGNIKPTTIASDDEFHFSLYDKRVLVFPFENTIMNNETLLVNRKMHSENRPSNFIGIPGSPSLLQINQTQVNLNHLNGIFRLYKDMRVEVLVDLTNGLITGINITESGKTIFESKIEFVDQRFSNVTHCKGECETSTVQFHKEFQVMTFEKIYPGLKLYIDYSPPTFTEATELKSDTMAMYYSIVLIQANGHMRKQTNFETNQNILCSLSNYEQMKAFSESENSFRVSKSNTTKNAPSIFAGECGILSSTSKTVFQAFSGHKFNPTVLDSYQVLLFKKGKVKISASLQLEMKNSIIATEITIVISNSKFELKQTSVWKDETPISIASLRDALGASKDKAKIEFTTEDGDKIIIKKKDTPTLYKSKYLYEISIIPGYKTVQSILLGESKIEGFCGNGDTQKDLDWAKFVETPSEAWNTDSVVFEDMEAFVELTLDPAHK